jgi:hypothetical protein
MRVKSRSLSRALFNLSGKWLTVVIRRISVLKLALSWSNAFRHGALMEEVENDADG